MPGPRTPFENRYGAAVSIYEMAEQRASIEDPSNPHYSALFDLLDDAGAKSTAGLRVTPEKALGIAALWRGIKMVADDVGKLPIKLYRKTSEGREEVSAHPVARLAHEQPNAEMGPMLFKLVLQAHALLRGGGFAAIIRDATRRPMELIPLRPAPWTYPVRVDGVLQYVTTLANGERRALDRADVIHLRGFGYDGLTGYSVVEFGTNSLGLTLGVEQYGARFFANDATPNIIIEVPKFLTPEQRKEFLVGWNKMQRGLTNAHKLALLQGGMQAKTLSFTARDAQLLELREFQVKEVALWVGVPAHKLGASANTSYNSLEQENQAYLDQAIDPWLVLWEEELQAKLLTAAERADGYYLEFTRDALLRVDSETRNATLRSNVNEGIMTLNESRARLNLPPLPGGDRLRVPVNLALTDENGDPQLASRGGNDG